MSPKSFAQSNHRLGSEVELRLISKSKLTAEKLFDDLWVIIDNFEKRFSRFSPDSELSHLNSSDGKQFEISDEMHQILSIAKDFNILTNGFYNPFILPNLKASGYSMDLRLTNWVDTGADFKPSKVCDFKKLLLGEDWAILPVGTMIDLGGIGKGFLADKLACVVEGQVDGYSINLGGDIIARSADHQAPWQVDIQSAGNPSKDVAIFTPKQNKFALATSGLVRQNGQHQVSHQINPYTGQVVSSKIQLASVAAPTAVAADVLASYLLSFGAKTASALIDSGEIFGALLQTQTGIIVLGEGFLVNQLGETTKSVVMKEVYV